MSAGNRSDARWTFSLSILATVISVTSLAVAVRSCFVTERSLKLHIQPELVCILDEHPSQHGALLFSLKNEGPVPATNVTVDHATLRYSKSEKRIRSAVTSGDVFDYSIPGQRWIFKDVLKPNEIIHKMAGEGALRDPEKAIDVLIFDISYYRDADGQAFAKRCPYYVDGPKILTPSQFRDHPVYHTVIRETANYLPQVRKMETPDSGRRQ